MILALTTSWITIFFTALGAILGILGLVAGVAMMFKVGDEIQYRFGGWVLLYYAFACAIGITVLLWVLELLGVQVR